LLNRIGRDHPRYLEALGYQQRLVENIRQTKRHGDTDTRRAERSEVIERLNELALSALHMRFGELCGLTTPIIGPEPTEHLIPEIKPRWLQLGREREVQRLAAFLQQKAGNTLWIWGNEGCGLREFLEITRILLQHEAADVVYFDAEDAAFGIAVDQRYFIDKLERWAGTAPETSSDQSENIDRCLKRVLAGAEGRLAGSDRRPVLIFANYHLLLPAIREWAHRTLWGQILGSLEEHNPLAIFACEGSAPTCPASNRESEIHLDKFTVQDIERFLRTLPYIDRDEIRNLARKIHSGDSDEFLAPPRRVYQNLIAEMILRGYSGRPG
jgi:hypothetical protein